MKSYYARKIDANQPLIVEALRKLGLRVEIINGVFDLLVAYGGISMPCEVRPVKGGTQKAREGKQAKFHKEFSVYWLRTVEDCVQLQQTLHEWATAIKVRMEGFPQKQNDDIVPRATLAKTT